MVQTYYALRQFVGSEGQKPLKKEFLSFMVNTRRICGLPSMEPNGGQSQVPLPTKAAICVSAAYDAQGATWVKRLSGPAAEEAARAPEQNVALQGRLRSLAFIPKDAVIDGVFGTGTRTALLAWQRAKGRAETSFLSDADASVLLATAPSEPDPFLKWRVKPLAQTEYHGKSVTIAYNNLQVTLDTEAGQAGGACGTPSSGILWPDQVVDEDRNTCRAIIARISVDGREVLTGTVAILANDTNIDWLFIKAAIRKLDTATTLPQVVITGFSGGAHCCTSTATATSGADGIWQFVGLEEIDGDAGYDFLDLSNDGWSVLIGPAEGFNYAFSSYAGSFAPTHIQRLTGAKIEDVTRDPRYQNFLLLELGHMQELAARQTPSEPNGYLAGWVAQKILVGQLQHGWQTMLASYNRKSTDGLTVCAVDKRVWVPSRYGSNLVCPEEQETLRTFPEALARHLAELGYLTPEQSVQLGFDPAKIKVEREAATVRYEEQMVSGWFVITRAGNCAMSLSSSSPAATITAARARGVEDDFAVLETGGDGKPVVVRVDEPKGNGLASSLTFYRGMARCESLRQQKKMEIENLR